MGNRILNYAWGRNFGLEKLVRVQFGEGDTAYIMQQALHTSLLI